MKFQIIAKILKTIPHISVDRGKILFDFIKAGNIKNILELGFAHGTSTCYMAAALEENGLGLITTIDMKLAQKRKPNIFSLLKKTNLEKYIQHILSESSYTWELKKIIEKQTKKNNCIPIYDFCFIDGAHTWEVDGLAFFLVEKLLKPGGWILFDDLNWSFSDSDTCKNTTFVQNMPIEEKSTAQVEKIFNLLVCQHNNFSNFKIEGDWAWAQKVLIHEEEQNVSKDIVDHVYLHSTISISLYSIINIIKENILNKIRKKQR